MIAIINGLKMRCYNNKIRKLPANKRNIKPYLPHSTTDFITDYKCQRKVNTLDFPKNRSCALQGLSY